MVINDLPKIMLECLVWTIGLEVLLAIILRIRKKKDIFNIMLVNILTNPLVVSISVAINIFYGLQARHISMIFLEIFAFFAEAKIYKNVIEYKKINPYLLSLLLNAFSFLIGLIINMV